MVDTHSCTLEPLSRRRLLRLGALAGGGAVIGLGLFEGPAANAAAAKVSKQTAGYQQSPKGSARCATCSFFEAPSSCNFVEGPINPTGWCTLYRAKT